MRICIDPGHGGGDPGCLGFGKNEKDLNLEYASLLNAKLQQYKDVQTIMTRNNDSEVGLSTRAQIANNAKADLFISCHLNASGAGARGSETIYSIYAKDSFKNFADSLGRNLADGLGIPFRRSFSLKGKNGDYFAVLRETKMPAIIVEALFLDNGVDNAKYNPNIIANTIAKEVVGFYNLQPKETPQVNTATRIYRVVCGSYTDIKNAENKVVELKKAGFESFII